MAQSYNTTNIRIDTYKLVQTQNKKERNRTLQNKKTRRTNSSIHRILTDAPTCMLMWRAKLTKEKKMTYAQFLKTLEADIEKMKKANFSQDEIDIVDTWYSIEYEEPDISFVGKNTNQKRLRTNG